MGDVLPPWTLRAAPGFRGLDLHEPASLAAVTGTSSQREQGTHKHPEAARRLSADAPGSAGEARGIFSTYLMTHMGADFKNSTPASFSVDMRGGES